MKKTISRRNFLKATSTSAAGMGIISLAPVPSAFAVSQDKSRVVIAKDEKCFANNQIDQARVQDMVDYAIMTLTNQSDKAKAYEALFPNAITNATKILIKENSSKPKTTRDPVAKAMKKGLTYMLGNSFPEANITVVDRQGAANTNEKFKVGNNEYTVKDIWVKNDYYIICSACWAITASLGGVTLAMKNMMPAVGGSSLSRMHNYTTTTETPWMPTLASYKVFNEKRVLLLTDAITYSIDGRNVANTPGYCIFATKDIVANDFLGTNFLKENGLPQANETTAKKVCELAAGAPYNLGTDNPDNMEVINIAPPWTTSVVTPGDMAFKAGDIRTEIKGNHTIFQYPGNRAQINVYNLHGKTIWTHKSSENRIIWSNNNNAGVRVPAGIYLYQLRLPKGIAQGRIHIQ